jgi:hypothetical protein
LFAMQPPPPRAPRPACPYPWQAAPSAPGPGGTTRGARDDGRDPQCSFCCGLPLLTWTHVLLALAADSNRPPSRPSVRGNRKRVGLQREYRCLPGIRSNVNTTRPITLLQMLL